MADEPENAGVEQAPPKKGLSKKLLAIIGGAVVLQGVLFFVVFKFIGGSPEAAHGDQNPALEDANVPDVSGYAEVQLMRGFKVPNDQTGVLRIYDIDLSVVVPADKKEELETLFEERGGEIADRIARIVRGATEEMLREIDLRVLRAQIRTALQEIVRDEKLVQRVLIPKFLPIRAD